MLSRRSVQREMDRTLGSDAYNFRRKLFANGSVLSYKVAFEGEHLMKGLVHSAKQVVSAVC